MGRDRKTFQDIHSSNLTGRNAYIISIYICSLLRMGRHHLLKAIHFTTLFIINTDAVYPSHYLIRDKVSRLYGSKLREGSIKANTEKITSILCQFSGFGENNIQ